MKRRYLVKIIPPHGYRVYRFEFTWRHVIMLAAFLGVGLLGAGVAHVYQLAAAEASVTALRNVADEQRAKLIAMNAEAAQIAAQIDSLRKKNQEIRRAIGLDARPRDVRLQMRDAGDGQAAESSQSFAGVATRLKTLAKASVQATGEETTLEALTMRVLSMRHVEAMARAQMLAGIPSLNPVDGSVTSGFGWRTNPWPEYHPGIDLAADYGQPVRAAAAGNVVTAGWDSGYGIKVDIDHGNRYHTWYAHLSSVEVSPGQHVIKGQIIARVGATGEATGPHLHFQVMLDGTPVDPAPYLNGIPPHILAATR
jgi:murein DD-endopeptidase MepM/ murein hydrolase activator NlpD